MFENLWFFFNPEKDDLYPIINTEYDKYFLLKKIWKEIDWRDNSWYFLFLNYFL